MFNLRSVCAFWAIGSLFFGAEGRAEAQTTTTGTLTVPNTGVKRDHQDYAGIVQVTQINFQDCLSEDFFTFTVNLGSNYAAYGLDVWACTSCETQSNRTCTDLTCWQLDQVQTNSIIVNDLKIPIRTLLSGRTGGSNFGAGGTGGTDSGGSGGTDAALGGGGGTDTGSGGGGGTDTSSGGSSGSDGSAVSPDAPAECKPTSPSNQAATLAVYFLQVDTNGLLGGQFTYKVTFKLNAPNPPTGVVAGTGENIVPVAWTATATSDQTIDGYQLYCDPAPGEQGLVEAGIVPDPNVLPVSCTESSILKPGYRPADKYKCGKASKTSTRANATGLVNNVAYNVAVAATDTFRNVGVISTADCGVPQPVTGFFEAYRNAGGEGGGGFCSFSRHGRPVFLLTVLGLGLGLVLRRRRAT